MDRTWNFEGYFQKLSSGAELTKISMDASIVQVYQHSAGVKKDGPVNKIGHSRGGNNTKIHAAVDAYSYPVSILISKGQRSDVTYAIPVFENITLLAVTYWLTGDMTVGNSSTISMKKAISLPSHQKKRQNLSAGVTGGNSKKDIWWKDIF